MNETIDSNQCIGCLFDSLVVLPLVSIYIHIHIYKEEKTPKE